MAPGEAVSFEEIAAEFRAVGLPSPPEPGEGIGPLHRLGPLHAASAGAPDDLYNADDAFDSWFESPSVRSWAVAHQGRGRVSWAIHQLSLEERIAVFVQVAWGRADARAAPDADVDDDDAVGVRAAFAAISPLMQRARSLDGGRAAVWLSDFGGDRWAAVPAGPIRPDDVVWHAGGRDEVRSAAEQHLATGGDAMEPNQLGGGDPDHDGGTREPTLEDYLASTDLDELAEWATAIPVADDAGERLIMRVVSTWDDLQAVANLLLHPRLLGAGYRTDVIARALDRGPNDYLTFAALVGLCNERPDIVSAPDDSRLLGTIATLAALEEPVLVARRAAAVLAGHAAHVVPSVLIPLLTHADEVVRHNALVALLRRSGLDEARRLLPTPASGDHKVADWLSSARAELDTLDTDDQIASTRFGGPQSSWVPTMDEWQTA